MAAKDILYTANIAFVAKGRRLLASCFDTLGDFCAVLTIGVGGGEFVAHGLHAVTLAIFAVMAVGSFIGTYSGMALETWINRKAPKK